MFENRPYHEINREERFFCFLFVHAILASASVRASVIELLRSNLRLNLKDADPLQVFVEVAALRDYWHDLGDPVRYNAETHDKRRHVLAAMLDELELSASLLDQHDLFWTSRERQKLWNPGRWSERAIKAAGLDTLLKLKWAFNAKPDLMLISGDNIILIEAKVESAEGKNGRGYMQLEIQKLIARLLHQLVPSFACCQFTTTTLEPGPDAGIQWRSVREIIEASNMDTFTKQCCHQLVRFD